MKKIASFFANVWRETSPPHKVAIGASALFLAVLVATCLNSGCATTKSGLAREQAVYQAATNVVAATQQVAPYLPPPASNIAMYALAAISGALTAWNAHQQAATRKLKNGNGTPPAQPPSPQLAALPPPQH